jgi:hypothetical protein
MVARVDTVMDLHVSSRLDVAAVKAFLGDAWRKFETAGVTTVIRIKAAQQLPAAA